MARSKNEPADLGTVLIAIIVIGVSSFVKAVGGVLNAVMIIIFLIIGIIVILYLYNNALNKRKTLKDSSNYNVTKKNRLSYDYDSEMLKLKKEIKSEVKEKTKLSETSKVKKSRINLETCSKEELLTLPGFNEEKAKRFISERNSGVRYYDINSFVLNYQIQPHEMLEIQNKLIFSIKPVPKKGRKIDW